MHITRFKPLNHPSFPVEHYGLQEGIDMKRLGKVVVLAGPNGAGKTRLLRMVKLGLEVTHVIHGLLLCARKINL